MSKKCIREKKENDKSSTRPAGARKPRRPRRSKSPVVDAEVTSAPPATVPECPDEVVRMTLGNKHLIVVPADLFSFGLGAGEVSENQTLQITRLLKGGIYHGREHEDSMVR